MKVLLFGATGMIGQGALRECLLADDVTQVTTVGRSPTGQQHAKLREVVHADLYDLSPLAAELGEHDACLFCLGVSASGMREADYHRITYDLTLSAAQTLLAHNPRMSFVYVSGAGTDSSERGRFMWARVKGKTENALLRLPFARVHMARPGYVQPVHGVRSRTRLYRMLYAVMGPLFPLWNLLFPGLVTTNERLGRALLELARDGGSKPVLENRDLNEIARRLTPA